MSGAQGAHPPGSFTPTTYESVAEKNRTRLDLRSKEDEGMVKVDKLQEKVEDPADGIGAGPAFAADDKDVDRPKPDPGITGTA